MKFLLIAFQLLFVPAVLFAQAKNNKEIQNVIAAVKQFEKTIKEKDSALQRPLGSYTEMAFKEKYDFYKTQYARLEALKKTTSVFDDQIDVELLQHELLNDIKNYEFRSYLNPILSDAGFHTNFLRVTDQVLINQRDAERYLVVLKDVSRFINENLQLMKKGLAVGINQPAVILDGYENTYLLHIVDSAERSVFFKPFLKKPAGIPDPEWQVLIAKAKEIIIKDVVNSYRNIKDFFQDEYLPKARKTLGSSHFPDGKAFYEDRVRHYTTTSLSSGEVYQVGLKEVDRIRKQMDSVMKVVNFTGSFKDFINFLRTDPRFYPKTADELIKEASFIAKKVDGILPSLFGKLPRQPYTVAPVPDYLAPTYTAGRYSSASNGRAGAYWVNTYNLPSRTLYTLEALTLHEAVPGHHLQSALTKELENLPEFRRNLYINAFGEGWGLYSEYLGHEMGLYKDPYSLFGRLTYEMWRACRLVIDVGVHTKDWTREQAVSYLADNTALSMHEVNTEINRYISWPGQALAYKIGEIKIKELRRKAEDALQDQFDVRAFHDMVLSNGTVTLSILEKMTDRFIEQSLKDKKKKSF
jgi:uncharacterized protein (DUF885 family)